MDAIINDIYIEFLEVAFHYILFLSNIYPKEIFENRKKYGTSVKYSVHPQVNSYITDCLTAAKQMLQSASLDKIVFCILDPDKNEQRRFVFDVKVSNNQTGDVDHYLIKCEQNLRAFCLVLANSKSFMKSLPENCAFKILLHTNETAALKLAKDPDMEHFPFIEHDQDELFNINEYFITPMHTINLDTARIQVYLEHQDELK